MAQLEIALSHFPLPPFPVKLCNDCRCIAALGRTMQYFFTRIMINKGMVIKGKYWIFEKK